MILKPRFLFFTVALAIIFSANFGLGMNGKDVGERNWNLLDNPFVQLLVGNSSGNVVVGNGEATNETQKDVETRNKEIIRSTALPPNGYNLEHTNQFLDETNEHIRERRDLSKASMIGSGVASSKPNSFIPKIDQAVNENEQPDIGNGTSPNGTTSTATSEITTVDSGPSFFDPVYNEINFQPKVNNDDDDEADDDSKDDVLTQTYPPKKSSSSPVFPIIIIVVEIILIFAFNIVSIVICCKFRGKCGGIKPVKPQKGAVAAQQPKSGKFNLRMNGNDASNKGVSKSTSQHPTLAQKQRTMQKLAPPSTMTTMSLKSSQRKGAGFDPVSLGSWSYNTCGENGMHTSEIDEPFSSPLDYLDAFGYGYPQTNTLTQTLGGSLTVETTSTIDDTDKFEDIPL